MTADVLCKALRGVIEARWSLLSYYIIIFSFQHLSVAFAQNKKMENYSI